MSTVQYYRIIVLFVNSIKIVYMNTLTIFAVNDTLYIVLFLLF